MIEMTLKDIIIFSNFKEAILVLYIKIIASAIVFTPLNIRAATAIIGRKIVNERIKINGPINSLSVCATKKPEKLN